MDKGKGHPLIADNFSDTFSRWGSFERRTKSSNLWHNPKIPPPESYDYKTLTADLHPDQNAYRKWLIDIMGYLLFEMRSTNQTIRFLELGCADAREIHMFLKDLGLVWLQQEATLEIHLLDDDVVKIDEAADQLDEYSNEQIRLYLWEGNLEKLASHEFVLRRAYPSTGDGLGIQRLPKAFDMVFAQLILHHYALFQLIDIYKDIFQLTRDGGYFLYSDICYTGRKHYDAMIWNRALRQIENMPDPKQRDFWLTHYKADYPTYHERHEVACALELVGYKDVEMLQCAYDMAAFLGRKSDSII